MKPTTKARRKCPALNCHLCKFWFTHVCSNEAGLQNHLTQLFKSVGRVTWQGSKGKMVKKGEIR